MTIPTTEVKSLQDIVKDRLRGNIAGLIPDELWDKMVENEVTYLTTAKDYHNDPFTGSRVQMTQLQALIRQELFNNFKSKILEELKAPEFAIHHGWQEGETILTNERLTEVLKSTAPDLMTLVVTQMFSSVVMSTVNALRQNRM